ncbi:MAG: shikimate dehydrogenase [Chlorobi bacterium]|nr:shikimate dehydrogenase [Chlorobiota bacterium]
MQFNNNHIKNNLNLLGIIGHPIKHSYSPLMHNLSFEINNLEYIYLPFDVPISELKNAIKGVTALGMTGLNVTVPHKERILPFLHDVSEEASVIGAVNTIHNDNGTLRGYNTDVHGVSVSLEKYKERLSDAEVTVIGAGGGARSVLYSLIRNFRVRRINIVNRTIEKAESLKEYFNAKMHFEKIKTYELTPPDLIEIFSRSTLIVNATAIGMSPDIDDSPTEIPESFNENQIVFDLVYNPIGTKFLSLAQSRGAETVNGLTMLVEQGAKSFEIWTGTEMPKEQILSALKSSIEQE